MAVSGTSGKSTVTAMIFEILAGAGRDPSVITGGDLRLLQAQGLPGNAFAGGSDLLVIEADESDGSLVRYAPAVGVILNLQRDHKEMAEVAGCSPCCVRESREALVVGEDENLDALAGGALRFGFGPRADIRGLGVELGPSGSRFEVEQVRFSLPVPGRHNVANALARHRRMSGARRASCRHGRAAWLIPGRRPALSDRRQGARRHRGGRLCAQRRQDHRRPCHGQAQCAARARHLPAAWLWADALPAEGLRRHFLTRAPHRRPAMDARSVLRRRHGVPRLLSRRHREARSPSAGSRPSSRRHAPGSRPA